jgi:hypothetical protein
MLKLIQRKKAKEKEIKNSEKFFRFFLHFLSLKCRKLFFSQTLNEFICLISTNAAKSEEPDLSENT